MHTKQFGWVTYLLLAQRIFYLPGPLSDGYVNGYFACALVDVTKNLFVLLFCTWRSRFRICVEGETHRRSHRASYNWSEMWVRWRLLSEQSDKRNSFRCMPKITRALRQIIYIYCIFISYASHIRCRIGAARSHITKNLLLCETHNIIIIIISNGSRIAHTKYTNTICSNARSMGETRELNGQSVCYIRIPQWTLNLSIK